MKIVDGTGKGNMARVDKSNRLLTEAVIESEQLEAAVKGNAYQVGSGAVVLTSASESAVLHLKNNEERDLIVSAVNFTSTSQAGASDSVYLIKLYLGSSGLSAGTNSAALNSNFGSSKSLDADVVVGGEGQTVTDGTLSGVFYFQEAQFVNTDLAWVIPKGASFAVSATPASGNTSAVVAVTFEAHVARETL